MSQTIFRTPMVIQSTSTVLTNSDFLSPKRRIAKTLRQSGHAGSFAVLLFSFRLDIVVFLSHSSSDKRGRVHEDKAIRDATHYFTSDHSPSTADPLGKNGRLRAFPGALCKGTAFLSWRWKVSPKRIGVGRSCSVFVFTIDMRKLWRC